MEKKSQIDLFGAVALSSFSLLLAFNQVVIKVTNGGLQPVFFAGLIFSTTFRETKSASSSFGANLIGATVGGFAEYLGMAIGFQNLSLLVISAYLASLGILTLTRGK